jgi:hypothetical protein
MLRDSHSLFEDFESTGYWWLPANPEYRVPGTVHYKAGDKITLELVGALNPNIEDAGNDHPELIWGTTESDRHFTLERVIQTKSRSSEEGVFSESYLVHRLFEGKHFHSTDDIKLQSLSVSYTSFEEWVTDCPFDRALEALEPNSIKRTASYQLPHAIFECRVDSLESTIRAYLSISGSIDIRELEWRGTGYVDILPDSPRSFDWFWQVHADLRNLLSLLMNEPTYAKIMSGHGEAFETSPGESSNERINVYIMNSSRASQEEIHPADMLLIFPTIKHNISSMLESWFLKAERLRAVYTLFFGSMYFNDMFPRFHFLNLIQAIETFHRNMRSGQYLSETDFEPIRSALTNAIPADVAADLRAVLKSKIKYGYEYSLRKRILLLFAELGAETIKLITDNPNEMTGKIVDTRNYFTHYTDELKQLAFEGDAVHHANYKLRVLLIILLLKEAGLSEAVIREGICGNTELLYGLSEGQGAKAFLAKLKNPTSAS